MPLEPGQQVGDYKIIEPIGAGGMGQVFRVEHTRMRLHYALKVLPPELVKSEEFVARFHDEAHVMAKLRHQHIVQVHNMSHDGGFYFLVMDYVVGPNGEPLSLHDLLRTKTGSRLSQQEALRFAIQVAAALDYAHREGVVHRDLKPANILIDEKNNARLTDFGLAKAIGEDFIRSQIHTTMNTMSGGAMNTLSADPTISPVSDPAQGSGSSRGTSSAELILGTYDYMAPEQRGELPGAEINATTDVYAFGVLLYRILTGDRPVGMAESPSQIVKGLNPKWDEIIRRCMRKNQGDRYPTGQELLIDLQHIGAGAQPQVSTPAPAPAHPQHHSGSAPVQPSPQPAPPVQPGLVAGKQDNTRAMGGLICGIISCVMICMPYLAFFVAITGMILSFKETRGPHAKLAKPGLILSVVGLILNILVVIAWIILIISEATGSNDYYYNGY